MVNEYRSYEYFKKIVFNSKPALIVNYLIVMWKHIVNSLFDAVATVTVQVYCTLVTCL